MNEGTADDPITVNLTTPVHTQRINGLSVDMKRLKEITDKLGMKAGEVASINGYRNAKGDMVPDYDSVRIEGRE